MSPPEYLDAAPAGGRAQTPAQSVLTPTQLSILHRIDHIKLPKTPTAADALMAVARLGGHLRSNGLPGWQVLSRGYFELLTLEAGYLLAMEGNVINH